MAVQQHLRQALTGAWALARLQQCQGTEMPSIACQASERRRELLLQLIRGCRRLGQHAGKATGAAYWMHALTSRLDEEDNFPEPGSFCSQGVLSNVVMQTC